MSQVSESTLETQKQQIEAQSKQIEEMLASANDEVIQIETQLETFIPTPAVTNTPAPSWIIPTATPVPVATPTLSPADMVKYKELQTRRDQLNEMRNLFQQAYGNLLVLKQQSNSDPALRQAQIQNTLALVPANLLQPADQLRKRAPVAFAQHAQHRTNRQGACAERTSLAAAIAQRDDGGDGWCSDHGRDCLLDRIPG